MKKLKFGNKRTESADGKFDSRGEKQRWEQLKLLEKAGSISGLTRQKTYKWHVEKEGRSQKIEYRADFEYTEDGVLVTEDFKSAPTLKLALFKYKAGLFYVEFGRHIRISTAKGVLEDYGTPRKSNSRGLSRTKTGRNPKHDKADV